MGLKMGTRKKGEAFRPRPRSRNKKKGEAVRPRPVQWESMLGNALLAEGSWTGLGAIDASIPTPFKRDREDGDRPRIA